MAKNDSLDILKQAILLERRGESFYRTVADQSTNDDVKSFFFTMAEEERNHIKILSDQFKSVAASGKFKTSVSSKTGTVSEHVLTPQVKDRISVADFEAAAISAAMLMEERSISLYTKRAKASHDPEEKKIYRWLASWETEHLDFLAAIDNDLKERIWNDSGFWPF